MKVSKDFGMVIRRDALVAKNIDLEEVMKAFNFHGLYDQSSEFLSLGPFFGGGAADSCMEMLQRLGLVYIEDFFIMNSYFPDWCRVEVFEVLGSEIENQMGCATPLGESCVRKSDFI